MTGHWLYLVATTLYCMLAVATSASAECARVLSQETGGDALAPGRPNNCCVLAPRGCPADHRGEQPEHRRGTA
jgi:hypothetical protein